VKTDIVFDEKLIIEPPKPILKSEYKCDKIFHVDSILPLYEQPELCGLVWMNGQDTSFYTIDMTNVEHNKINDRSTRLRKHNKGGQSSARFGRLHDEAVIRYLKTVAEDMTKYFENVKVIMVGGNGNRKDQLIPYLTSNISEKIIGNIVLSDKETLSNVCSKMEEFYLKYQENMEEQALKEFTDKIDKDTSRAIYGKDMVEECIKNGSVKKLFSSVPLNSDHGCDYYLIGKSRVSQILIQTYGATFGVSWY